MACGSCGGKNRANSEYEVTFGDGTKERFATAGEARIRINVVGTLGGKASTIKVVSKIAK